MRNVESVGPRTNTAAGSSDRLIFCPGFLFRPLHHFQSLLFRLSIFTRSPSSAIAFYFPSGALIDLLLSSRPLSIRNITTNINVLCPLSALKLNNITPSTFCSSTHRLSTFYSTFPSVHWAAALDCQHMPTHVDTFDQSSCNLFTISCQHLCKVYAYALFGTVNPLGMHHDTPLTSPRRGMCMVFRGTHDFCFSVRLPVSRGKSCKKNFPFYNFASSASLLISHGRILVLLLITLFFNIDRNVKAKAGIGMEEGL